LATFSPKFLAKFIEFALEKQKFPNVSQFLLTKNSEISPEKKHTAHIRREGLRRKIQIIICYISKGLFSITQMMRYY
jgi:hypothetical protein